MSALVAPKARAGTPLDRAAVALLRLVMMDGWRPEPAARVLRNRVHQDQRILRLLHARVVRAMRERPTEIDRRARTTLERALSFDEPSFSVRGGELVGARR